MKHPQSLPSGLHGAAFVRGSSWQALSALVASLMLFALPGEVAVVADDRLAPTDVFELEAVSDPQISQDGTRILYVRQFSDIMSDKNYSNLWIINADGTENRPLTSGHRSDSSPRWSPDGTRIVYLSDQEGTAQIYVRWMDIGQTARLTNLQHAPSGLAWSPDGKWISFVSFVPDKGPQIAELPSAPAGAKWAESATVIDKLTYRFDGQGYLKPGYQHVFVVPAEGGTARQITHGNFHHGGPSRFSSGGAVWTPDGRFLLVAANRRPDYEFEPLDSEIHEFSLATGEVKPLTRRKGPDHSPALSPDGRQIAYLGFDDAYQGYQVTRLYVMNRDGSGSKMISGDLDRDATLPRWAEDGRGVCFLYDDQGNTKLGMYSADRKLTTLAGNIGSGRSAYGGGGLYTVTRNGVFAATYTSSTRPVDLAVATLQNPKFKLITAVNDDLLDSKTLGAVEEIWYESSLDRRRIQGWIIKPPKFDPARKYPLILEIHGGPFANYGGRFDFEKQLWAAKDYVILYVNPRGSTSYGAEFGNLIHHSYPGDDFFDLNSGVDAVIAKGSIDAQNLFVTGGSGGGVLTCWMIGRTNRFRAAASAYPVINWSSFALTADISAFVTKYWFPALPWEDAAHYEKRSLLSVVKNVKTPTLVITGEEDYRTPMSESEQYYQALKLLKVESVLVRVPGEPHGIRRRPSHWMAKMLHIVGWFEKHKAPAAAAP